MKMFIAKIDNEIEYKFKKTSLHDKVEDAACRLFIREYSQDPTVIQSKSMLPQ